MAKTVGLIEKELPKKEEKKTFIEPIIDEEKVKKEVIKEGKKK